MKWLGSIFTALVVIWLTGALNWFAWPPERTWLAFQNLRRDNPHHIEDSFRIVLCWLENDSGNDTKIVEAAFTGVEGIKLIRSARSVAASGAADEWRSAMQQRALAVLADWNADVAIVGTVKKPGEILSLWFVPRSGQGTLGRGDQPYKLEDVTLGADFHDELRAQLTATALVTVAPLADSEVRGRMLEKGLRDVTEKLSNLLDGRTIRRAEHAAALHLALGNALTSLGERESGTERLVQAVAAYRTAFGEYTRERAPVQWALTQHNLGNALWAIGERERGTETLEQALAAHRAALTELSRERAPLAWAKTQINVCRTLGLLGMRESDTERLEQAVAACRGALDELTREHAPLEWAMAQNNLGNALAILAKWEGGTERLEQSVAAYRAALEEATRERVPLDWALTQHNLGNALRAIGEREKDIETLEQALAAHRAALTELSREHTPLEWATVEQSLDNVLSVLGRLQEKAK